MLAERIVMRTIVRLGRQTQPFPDQLAVDGAIQCLGHDHSVADRCKADLSNIEESTNVASEQNPVSNARLSPRRDARPDARRQEDARRAQRPDATKAALMV
jgi:hypothetical protein